MKDLAPNIYRQRLVIEGHAGFIINDEHIRDYLGQLSGRLHMVTLTPPVTHLADEFGRAGWIHWSTSGAHFYAWDKPVPFFSVDIYTCKAFATETAVSFTQEYFKTKEITFKEV